MDNKALAKTAKEQENEKKVQMLKFCIISNFRSQFSKNNLIMFTLDSNT